MIQYCALLYTIQYHVYRLHYYSLYNILWTTINLSLSTCLQRALEESRKEKEKEDRRRRFRQRKARTGESEIEEQHLMLREIQKEKGEEAQVVAAAAETPELTQELGPSGVPAAKVRNIVINHCRSSTEDPPQVITHILGILFRKVFW